MSDSRRIPSTSANVAPLIISVKREAHAIVGTQPFARKRASAILASSTLRLNSNISPHTGFSTRATAFASGRSPEFRAFLKCSRTRGEYIIRCFVVDYFDHRLNPSFGARHVRPLVPPSNTVLILTGGSSCSRPDSCLSISRLHPKGSREHSRYLLSWSVYRG